MGQQGVGIAVGATWFLPDATVGFSNHAGYVVPALVAGSEHFMNLINPGLCPNRSRMAMAFMNTNVHAKLPILDLFQAGFDVLRQT